MSEMICIYCDAPDKDSLSHIIPEALGKGPTLEGAVCESCNHAINRGVEQKVVKKMEFFRHMLNLTGRHRSRTPPLRMEASFLGCTYRFRITDPRDFDSQSFIFQRAGGSPDKAEGVAFVAQPEQLESLTGEYERRHPGVRWKVLEADEVAEKMTFHGVFDFGFLASAEAQRLAAKVALEWWCSQRQPDDVKTPEFEAIARFARHGIEPGAGRVSIVSSPAILSSIANVPIGVHTLLIATDPRNTNLVVLVGIFSLVFHKVILSRRHPPIAKREDLTLINPQTGFAYAPTMRPSLRSGPSVSADSPSDLREPLEALLNIEPYLRDRLNRWLDDVQKQAG